MWTSPRQNFFLLRLLLLVLHQADSSHNLSLSVNELSTLVIVKQQKISDGKEEKKFYAKQPAK